MLRVISLVLLGCGVCYGYKAGAPPNKCDNMTPWHNGVAAQTTESPYKVTVDKNIYKEGDTLKVSVSSTTDTFKGYFIQVRNNAGESIPGFSLDGQPDSKFVTCSADTDAVTHSNNTEQSSVTFTFTAPDVAKGNLTVFATVVKDYRTFWVKITSNNVTASSTVIIPSLAVIMCLICCSFVSKKLF